MTEKEWLACNDAYPMVDMVNGTLSDRRFRLFGTACCRNLWSLLVDHRSKEMIVVAEKYAEGNATEEEFFTASKAASQVDNGRLDSGYYAAKAASRLGWKHADGFDSSYHTKLLWYDVAYIRGEERGTKENPLLLKFLRDITGNPFRSLSISPTWLTPTVTNLATIAYEERILPSGELDTVRLSILADALEESGCSNADILSHLRSSGPHVLGCHVLDLILGKE